MSATLTAAFQPPTPPAPGRRVSDLLADLGVSADRVLLDPPPGTATEADLIAACDRKILCELVGGALVEKAMGFAESHVAAVIIGHLYVFLQSHDLGFIAGADGLVRFTSDQVRVPDVCFVLRGRCPGGMLPRQRVSDVIPNLVVEVVSRSNTDREMAQKLAEYFAAGVELVWKIDPGTRSAEVYTSPTAATAVPPDGALDGGTVLPGLVIPLAGLFTGFDPPPAA